MSQASCFASFLPPGSGRGVTRERHCARVTAHCLLALAPAASTQLPVRPPFFFCAALFTRLPCIARPHCIARALRDLQCHTSPCHKSKATALASPSLPLLLACARNIAARQRNTLASPCSPFCLLARAGLPRMYTFLWPLASHLSVKPLLRPITIIALAPSAQLTSRQQPSASHVSRTAAVNRPAVQPTAPGRRSVLQRLAPRAHHKALQRLAPRAAHSSAW